jgi:Flp pilus assembly protein TadG
MELALLSPWMFFLFAGAFDWGFYAYSLITLETATRSAVVGNISNNTPTDSAAACTIVLNEMKTVVNMIGVTVCSGTPVSVTAAQVTGPDTEPAAQVAVTYTMPRLIPIPGLLSNNFTITRVVTMKI